jgi:hypothetical protein
MLLMILLLNQMQHPMKQRQRLLVRFDSLILWQQLG